MELFDKKFVHFMWDDELKGKDVFVADNIADLIFAVRNDGKCGVKTNALCSSPRASLPFLDSILNNCYTFAYYDPNYEAKRAFNAGKEIQVHCANGTWRDCDKPKWYDDCAYRVKPEEEKWIVCLARADGGTYNYLYYCEESEWESVQKDFGAKTKLFTGTKNEAVNWYESRKRFTALIKAWEDNKKIQVLEGDEWLDVEVPWWRTDCEYRIKPECPCEDGIDSKACVGCEQSKDGKRKYKPYVTVDEFIQDFQERFPTAVPRPAHTMPLIWLRRKNEEQISFVTDFIEGRVRIEDAEYTMAALLDIWTYLDGSPVGIEVKE